MTASEAGIDGSSQNLSLARKPCVNIAISGRRTLIINRVRPLDHQSPMTAPRIQRNFPLALMATLAAFACNGANISAGTDSIEPASPEPSPSANPPLAEAVVATPKEARDRSWNWHLQNTDIIQGALGFPAKYSGPNRFDRKSEFGERSSTLLSRPRTPRPALEMAKDRRKRLAITARGDAQPCLRSTKAPYARDNPMDDRLAHCRGYLSLTDGDGVHLPCHCCLGQNDIGYRGSGLKPTPRR